MASTLRASGAPGGQQGRAGPVRRLTAEDRRRQLLEVALQTFAERGFRATTMDEIAEAAGVTKPLVYQHFPSKRALYLELVDSVASDLVAAITDATAAARGPRQQVEMGFAAYFRLVVTHRAAFQLLHGRDHAGDPELGDPLRRVEDAIAEAIEPLIDAGLAPEHRRLLAYAVVGLAEGASRHWMAAGQPVVGPGTATGDGPRGRPGEDDGEDAVAEEAARLAGRVADLAWAGLRAVHAD